MKNIENVKEFIRKVLVFNPFNKPIYTNSDFYQFLYELIENEKKSADEIKIYQFEKLKEIVKNAYNKSPFYKEKYDKYGFHPNDLDNLDDLKNIPYLTKEEIRKNSKSMILRNINEKIYIGHTSGTTGTPLELYYTIKSNAREWASICYQWMRVGYRPTDGRVEFRDFIQTDVDYLYFPNQRILRINIVKMNEDNIDLILKKIIKVNYKFFHGYPSAIYKFATILDKKGIIINPLGILLASEVLYEWQLKIIEKVFPNSKIIIHYGQAERVVLGAWLDDQKYHFIPSYGILEIDKNNNEMIGTGFINEIMPFIRYRLTDTVEGFNESPTDSELCLFPLIEKIQGRIEDYTYNLKGEMIPPAVVTFPFKKLNHIKSSKLIQYSLEDFDLIFEAKENSLTIKEAEHIINDLRKIYSSKVKFHYIFVEKILVDKSGKFRWIECKIPKSDINEIKKE